jgi:hypothetical protein
LLVFLWNRLHLLANRDKATKKRSTKRERERGGGRERERERDVIGEEGAFQTTAI